MKIKKILLYNFKNFKDKTVIDFNNNITFLVGPNGFGKTTIFDAIELGLTGNISRVNSKDKITPENIKYNKPFFQNDINYPVIIKLWLDKENNEQLIIVRKFENNSPDRKNAFAPLKSIKEFKLFKQEEINNSEFIDIYNFESLRKVNQDTIDKFLDVNEKYEIAKIFNLFNYIQQEETTFFLKQSEQKRSDSLSFLIKTDDTENKIEKINKTTKAMGDIIKKLKEEQGNLTQQEMGDIPYHRLFNHTELPFDQKVPFTVKNISQLETYRKSIQNILEFKQNFSIPEYKRKMERNDKKKMIDKNLATEEALRFCILFSIIRHPDYNWQREEYTLRHPVLFEYVLLEQYISEYDKVITNFNRRNQLNEYYNNISSDINNMDKQKFDCNKNDSLSDDFEVLKKLFFNYQALRNNASQTDKNLSDLKQLRNNLNSNFKRLGKHAHIDDTKCPFCNSQFQSIEELDQAYDDYESYLIEISSQNSKQLQNEQSKLNKSVIRLKEKIADELNKLKINVDEKLLEKIKELKNSYNTLYQEYFQDINDFKIFIQFYTNMIPFQLGRLSFNDFYKQCKLNQENFKSKLLVEEDVYSLLDTNNLENVEKKFNEIKNEYPNFDFISFQMKSDLKRKIDKDNVEKKLENLKKQLQKWIDQKYSINENIIVDFNKVLSNYFDNNLELLEKISIKDIEQKKHYIEKQGNLVKNQQFKELSKKIKTLNETNKYLIKINEIYKKEVKKFKINIIKKLRIPFFIYSAKMLQNYQQGLGIFLTYKEATENTEERAVIKFKPDPSNDHDAIHQLSTGQLAVVSLAFTLSLNTMFKLSEHLQFLMIDDPIQDMDAMNVLSFVEILRHGIIDKYQIILSTYNDLNALFMGYKFVNSNSKVEVDYKNVRELGV